MKDSERQSAEEQRARWGCGRAKAEPLPRREAQLAEAFERWLGVPKGSCTGCPFEGVFRAELTGGWLHELLRARVLVADCGVPWPEALGRPLVPADTAALAAWKSGQARTLPGDDDE